MTGETENGSRMTAGQEAVKFLKPFGCVLVLLLTAIFFFICFSSCSDPIKGYTPPHDSDYYAEHIDELQTELVGNVFPLLDGSFTCEISDDGTLAVTISGGSYVELRAAILRYYDAELFTFSEAGK